MWDAGEGASSQIYILSQTGISGTLQCYPPLSQLYDLNALGRVWSEREVGRSYRLAGAGEQGKMQTSKISPWGHLASTMAADSSSSQITTNQGRSPFHGSSTISAWQGSSSQFPIAVPLHPAHCCVWPSWPFLWVSLQGQKSGGNSTLAHGRAAFLEGKRKKDRKLKNFQFS